MSKNPFHFDVSMFMYFFVPGILLTSIMIFIYYLIGKKRPQANRLWTLPIMTFGVVAIMYAPVAAVYQL